MVELLDVMDLFLVLVNVDSWFDKASLDGVFSIQSLYGHLLERSLGVGGRVSDLSLTIPLVWMSWPPLKKSR